MLLLGRDDLAALLTPAEQAHLAQAIAAPTSFACVDTDTCAFGRRLRNASRSRPTNS